MDRPQNPDERTTRAADAARDASDSEEESGTATARQGMTRAIDADDLSTVRSDRDLAQDDSSGRYQADVAGGFNPDAPLGGPADLPESVAVTDVAPDGTNIGRTLNSLSGEAITGGGMSDAIQSRAGELGGDALGRGLDFDLLAPGVNDARPGGEESTGDPTIDRAIMGNDGSLMSRELKKMDPNYIPPKQPGQKPIDETASTRKPKDFDAPPTEKPATEEPSAWEQLKDYLGIKKDPQKMDNPEGDAVDSETNLERVTVMQGSAVNPSTNPNDGGDGLDTDPILRAELESGARPGTTVLGMPAQEGAVEATTLTQAGALGSSPVTNPTDPVLGDDGIIHGGSYAGGGSGAGGGGVEATPLSMTAGDITALGGEGDANLPITLRTGPAAGSEAAALGGEGDANLPITVRTGPTGGSEAAAPGGEGDANLPITVEPAPVGGASALGGEGEANLPITVEPAPVGGPGDHGQKVDINGASIDMATGQIVGSGDASLALGAPDAAFGGESVGGPQSLEGPASIGEEGPPHSEGG